MAELWARSQPLADRGEFACSDPYLDQLWRICRSNLRLCLQDIHLDSPHHQEPLGDHGDYLVEMLMAYYAFGMMEKATVCGASRPETVVPGCRRGPDRRAQGHAAVQVRGAGTGTRRCLARPSLEFASRLELLPYRNEEYHPITSKANP